MKTDPRVDAYIAKAPAFAQSILTETRQRVAQALADGEETIKWNVPFFLVSGKMVASMAAFKKHVKVGIWDGERPSFQDLVSVSELMPAKDFVAQLRNAAHAAPPAKPAQKAPARPAQKAPAKPVQKAPTKPVQKAPTKKASAKKPSAMKAPVVRAK